MNFPIYLRYRKYSFMGIGLLLLCLMPFIMPDSPGRTHTLNMQGLIKSGKEKIIHAKIEVFIDSVTRLFVTASDTAGFCEFELPLQNSYVIKFSSYGFLTKKITVDTHVPKKMDENYFCEFETEMYPPVAGIDATVLNHPVANFFFNSHKKNFDYDQFAAAKINRELRLAYAKYYNEQRENLAARNKSRQVPALK